jgi:protein-tyrosine phosphatase
MNAIIAPSEDRLVPLAGGFNLRDFGGYATADGRRVKRGMLYRSGTMALLTDEDAATLRSLGIRTVFDLRRADERKAQPTRWHEGSDTVYWSRDYIEESGVLGAMLRDETADAALFQDTMTRIYGRILKDHAPSYAAMFDHLARGDAPLLVNCAAGKDRTGVAVALVLLAIGVSREDVIADYLLTNDHCDWNWRFSIEESRFSRAYRDTPERIMPVLRAESFYLDAMFVALKEQHGGLDGYLKEIGVSDEALGSIRALLVEEPA